MICVAYGRGGCRGRMTRHHAIPKSLLKRTFPRGAKRQGDLLVPMSKLDPESAQEVGLYRIKYDERNYCVPICFGHHMDLEAKRWYLSRSELPASVEEFAAEFNFGWYLDRYYPLPESEAA